MGIITDDCRGGGWVPSLAMVAARWRRRGGNMAASSAARAAQSNEFWNERNIQIRNRPRARIKCCFIANSQIRLWPINDPVE